MRLGREHCGGNTLGFYNLTPDEQARVIAYDRTLHPELWKQPKKRSFRKGDVGEIAASPQVSATPEALDFWFGGNP